MPKHKGQTDSVLKIQLKSALTEVRWGLADIAQGGSIPIEVSTAYVADGSDVKIAIKDLEGNAVDTLDGKLWSNFYRGRYTLSKPNKTGGMYFEAELSAHGLKGSSARIRVSPPVKIHEAKWSDETGSQLKEIAPGQTAVLSAKVEGAPEGSEGYIELRADMDGHGPESLTVFRLKVKGGKLSVAWKAVIPGKEDSIPIHQELAKFGLDYAQPVLSFEAGCKGMAGLSPEAKLISWIAFDFGPPPEDGKARTAIFEMPDGTEKEEAVPEDGKLKLASAVPGRIIFKGFAE